MDDLMKRFLAIAGVVIVVFLFMPRRKHEEPQQQVTEAASAPVTSAPAAPQSFDEIDSDTVRSLVEADEHFATPLTSHCPKRTSFSYPDPTVVTLARMNSVDVAKDGTVSLTSDGFLNNASTKDEGDHWTFTTANRKFVDVTEKHCDRIACHVQFTWTWEPTVIGQDLHAVSDTSTAKTSASFSQVDGQWKLSSLSLLR